jgi:hypothetical protein
MELGGFSREIRRGSLISRKPLTAERRLRG